MNIICPVCGSSSVLPLNRSENQYRCQSCDSVFSPDEHTAPLPQPTKNAPKNTAKTVYRENIESVMEIMAIFGDDSLNGTGFYISKDGYLLTNAHVIVAKSEEKYCLCDAVYASKSRSDDYSELEIVYMDAKHDLALLKLVDQTTCKAIALAEREVETGDKVVCIGNSKSDGLTLLEGIVGDAKREYQQQSAFLFSAPVTNGCSGGPIFNERGKVCGVIVAGFKSVLGMNYGIPLSTVLSFLDEAKQEKECDLFY